MRAPVLNAFGSRAAVGQVYRFLGHFRFWNLAIPGSCLDRMAIAITCGKIHFRVNPRWVETQGLVDVANRFDELTPVQSTKETQTIDGVTNRYLVGGLVLAFQVHQLIDQQPLVSE